MSDPAPLDPVFLYKGCHFLFDIQQTPTQLFLPRVRYEYGLAGVEPLDLPVDTDPYGSAPEAWRHAQQQAVRWVHDRTGDGQGRF